MFEKSFSFLRLLKQNNNRDWYHGNKHLYAEAKQEFEHIVELLIHETSKIDTSILGLTPKEGIFRIFRDVRFSKDKTPYKTNFGAFLVPGGRKSFHAGYYLHLEPEGSFIASGIYMPPSNILRAIRNDIFEHFEEYETILNSNEIAKEFGEVSGDKLKLPPKGFPKEFRGIEQLKFKSFGLSSMRTDEQMQKADSIEDVLNLFEISKPFISFLNEAIKNAE